MARAEQVSVRQQDLAVDAIGGVEHVVVIGPVDAEIAKPGAYARRTGNKRRDAARSAAREGWSTPGP
jgi:hypothetical protein